MNLCIVFSFKNDNPYTFCRLFIGRNDQTSERMIHEEEANPLRVSELVVYPIKSLPGISLTKAIATPLGLSTVNGIIRDRSYMIVSKKDGRFMTLRGPYSTGLCGIEVDWYPSNLLTSEEVDPSDCHLILRAPSGDASGSAIDPLKLPAVNDAEGDGINVTVWEWEGPARVVGGAHASEWISRVLGVESHIVHCDPATHNRDVDPAWVNETPARVLFADGFPYLFVFEESLKDLNTHIVNHGHEAIAMKRFRGNICVAGGMPWQEDCMRRVALQPIPDPSIDGGIFSLVKPCSRCAIPSVDPQTGQKNEYVREALAAMRKGTLLGWEDPPSFKHSTFFGINACLVAPEGASITSSVEDGRRDAADQRGSGDGQSRAPLPMGTVAVSVGDHVTVLRATMGPFIMNKDSI